MAETYEYRGVLFAKMGRKADAQKDLATLKKLNSKLAGELEQFLKTGKEVEEYGGTSPKRPARLLACQSSARGESRHSLQRTENATWRDREECEMRKYQPITRTSLRGAEGTAFGDEETEQLGPVKFLLEAVEDSDQQLERVLGHLRERPTELERYVYLIKLCDRNERLFHRILMSDRIRFLLATDSRRRLLEIWSHFRSVVRQADFDQSQGTSRAAAA